MFLKLIVLVTNCDTIVLIGESWPQNERLFESVDQSSIILLRLSANTYFSLFKNISMGNSTFRDGFAKCESFFLLRANMECGHAIY